jgi:hypothetical protein
MYIKIIILLLLINIIFNFIKKREKEYFNEKKFTNELTIKNKKIINSINQKNKIYNKKLKNEIIKKKIEKCDSCIENCLDYYDKKKCFEYICKDCIQTKCKNNKNSKNNYYYSEADTIPNINQNKLNKIINTKNLDSYNVKNLDIYAWEYLDRNIIEKKILKKYPCLISDKDILYKLIYKVQMDPF